MTPFINCLLLLQRHAWKHLGGDHSEKAQEHSPGNQGSYNLYIVSQYTKVYHRILFYQENSTHRCLPILARDNRFHNVPPARSPALQQEFPSSVIVAILYRTDCNGFGKNYYSYFLPLRSTKQSTTAYNMQNRNIT